MRSMLRFFTYALFATTLATAGLLTDRLAAQKLAKDGNRKEALAAYTALTTRPRSDDPRFVCQDLLGGIYCIRALPRQGTEFDAFMENAIRAQKGNWQLLEAAAERYREAYHSGFIVGGEFLRSPHRDAGELAHVHERDRVRSLQLMRDAEKLIRKEKDPSTVAQFYLRYARLYRPKEGWAWRMQTLTDLDQLPDVQKGRFRWSSGFRLGAPVGADGKPVLYSVPESLKKAVSDGERWRWLLAQSEKACPEQARSARWAFAGFLYQQFGVHTIRHAPPSTRLRDGENGPHTLDLRTLTMDETICRLATGTQRLQLPEEFSYIRIFEKMTDPDAGHASPSLFTMLATICENRRQYEMAVTYLRRRDEFGGRDKEKAEHRIQRIVGNWGQFEPVQSQPAGRPATVDFRFRNGKSVELTAYRIDMEKVLADIVAHVKSQPEPLDWNRVSIGQLGHRLLYGNQTKYIAERVAQWSLDLEPATRHFDRRITITTPLRKGGVYLLTGKMKGGNTTRILMQLDDLVVARKQLDEKVLYYVADAVTGVPAETKLSFFGYRMEPVPKTEKYTFLFKEFAAVTNADGQLVLGPDRLDTKYHWLVSARSGNCLAWHELSRFHFGQRQGSDDTKIKTFVITDRPAYRPKHKVHWKAWVRHAQYGMADTSQFAGQTFWVEIHNSRRERLCGAAQVADEYGGLKGELKLKADASLGKYWITVRRGRDEPASVGGSRFRVEEYKKPEFEVTVETPTEPIMLGEKIEAKVRARYYFGAPVTEATVKVRVMRSAHDARWFPSAPWDWFYGLGYWWFGYDYDWYPGWNRWGCMRPVFSGWNRSALPPELVSETEVEIGEDGTVAVPIDTAMAKLMHGDVDHRYDITAEVRDRSRRTIVGTGKVLVAREPFKIYAWTNRGYYRVGETVHASFQARRMDGRPVAGKGKLRLLKVTYGNRKPRETEVQSWDLATGSEGFAEQRLKASRPGQYRLSYTVTDSKGHDIEGGHVFVVRGEGFDGGDYRFNHIELVPNKKEYRPGEGVELMINTDRPDSTVLLFVRPTDGVYLPPKLLRLRGKSTVVTLQVTKKDMPNFFVEAMTVADGKLHTDVREILVPPEKRVLTVDVVPNKERYKPGEEGTARIRLTDEKGNPFVGSVVVTVYDKSLEHILVRRNTRDIKSFFWKWRRRHSESTFLNLNRWFTQLLVKGEGRMDTLGVFGHMLADEARLTTATRPWYGAGSGRRGGGFLVTKGEVMARLRTARARPKMASESVSASRGNRGKQRGGGTGAAGARVVSVRTNFADTALWIASRQTGADGTTTIDLPMPESLTTWKIRVWAMGHGTKVGEGNAEVITSKDLIVRLQAPRFFVETDEVVLSANIHSYVDRKRKVDAILELDGPCLKALSKAKRTITLKPNGERRVDWRVKAMVEGEAVVRMKAIAADDADAMEMRFPVFVHGMDKVDSYCGVIRPDKRAGGTTLNIPKERRPETARLEVRYSPTLAMAMTDALPYLIAYPYGCTEQTLNRFLPAVLTQRTLQRLGVSLEQIRKKRADLSAQEIGDPAERAKQWKRYGTPGVWDEAEMAKIVKKGVEALSTMQLSDGGWGWFSGYGEHSYPHTTAQVVHGLTVATRNDVAVEEDVIERGVAWLKRYEAEQVQMIRNSEQAPKVDPRKSHADHMDAMVYMVLAEHDHLNAVMRDYLYRDRRYLSLYAKGMFGIALHQQKQVEKRDMVIRNIRQVLKTDDENQAAYLDMGNGGYWWWWYGDNIEAHAIFLRLLAATEPKGATAHRLVKYLLNNRKHATYWKSTRDTAACVEAFADYIKASGEDKPDQTIQVVLDGKVVKGVKVNGDNLFSFDNTFVLSGEDLGGGDHKLELRKRGTGPLYWNAYASYFTLQEFIPKTGLEVKVERRVYRLKPVAKEIDVSGSRNQALKQKVEKVVRVPVKSGDKVTSGDLIEIELLVESKNDYEYILLEDFKAAGMEPIDVRSGYTRNALGAYVEFRDERVSFFVRRLMRGTHSVSYRLRAETPGSFSALPTTISAMYAPELRGNSDEIKVKIKDE